MVQAVSHEAGAALRPVSQESTVDRVTDEIRRSILAGHLPPGEPFSITEISAQLQVSHIPVREALRRLEGQGLLRLRAGRSAVVTPVDMEEARSVYRLRRLIEVDVAGRSANRFTPDDLAQMERAIKAFFDETLAPDDMLTEHHRLHIAILRPAASEWDMRILELLWQTSERYVRLVFSNQLLDHDRAHRLGQSHEALVEAARAGSAATLKRLVREHLDDNERTILDGLTGFLNRP